MIRNTLKLLFSRGWLPVCARRMTIGSACMAVVALGLQLMSHAVNASPVAKPIIVGVSVPPQAYLVDRIGAEHVRTIVMVPPGTSTHAYEPRPGQMIALEDARIFVRVGHPAFSLETQHIDPFLQRRPGIVPVDMANGASGETLSADDPHLWVAPSSMRAVVAPLAAALIGIDPTNREEYERNRDSLLREIDQIDAEIRQRLSGRVRRSFLVAHPSWGYFARQYDLEQVSIEEEGKDPGPADLIALVERAKREGIRTVFSQKGFSARSAEVIARELDGRVIELDPMSYDWANNLQLVAARLREALTK